LYFWIETRNEVWTLRRALLAALNFESSWVVLNLAVVPYALVILAAKQMNIFVTGGTGYVGRALIPELLARSHNVRALTRKPSAAKLPSGCEPVFGNALDASTFVHSIAPCDTFVQLVGVAHPSPGKADAFREIDLVSVRESVAAASKANVQHFVYLSVAQPAPIMKDYQAVRAEGEAMIRASGMRATFLRPWYILGPGHRWPYLLLPGYWIAGILPWTREGARRTGLVTLAQMVRALIKAVENPADKIAIVEVPDIRKS
jgi:uncharacterized protein YbjT (DUF2867 family)